MGPGWELAKVRGTRFNTGDAIEHGARDRRRGARQLVGLPRGGLGPQRAGDRRPRGGRRLPEALLSVGRVHQRRRQALRRRGRGLPQLHLRQVRARDPAAAEAVRLADLRRQGEAAAARRIPDPPGHEDRRQYARRARLEDGRHRPEGRARDAEEIQRRGAHRHRVQSEREGRALHRRPGRQQEQLGQHARHAAVRGLRCHLWHHVQLRRPEDQHRHASDQFRRRADPRPLRRGRAGGRDLLVQLSRRLGAHQRFGVRQDRRSQRGEGSA